MIAAQDLELRAGARTLLENVSFEIRPAEFVAVLGPNGAGKTTLLRTLAGVLEPARGSVLVDGTNIHSLPPARRAQTIAHVASEEIFIDQLGVRDVVSAGRYPHHRWYQWREDASDDRTIESALEAVGMQLFAERRFSTLSSGERQRVWLAMALAQEAPLLLLDEPTSHLDVRAAQEMLRLLRLQVKIGKSVVCVLHDVNEAAQFADRIMLLGGGSILAFDDARTVLGSPLLDRAYGTGMERLQTASGDMRVFPAPESSSTEP